MKKETLIWTIILIFGAALLAINAATRHAGQVHVQSEPHDHFYVADELELPWGGEVLVARSATAPGTYVHPSGETMTLPPRSDGEVVELVWKDTTVRAKWRKVWKPVEEREEGDIALPQEDDSPDRKTWTTYNQVTYKEYVEATRAAGPDARTYSFSWTRTVGLWVGALFTLAIFSFLYRDNPFYKFAESVVVGVSAGYWMVVSFWDVLVPNLLGKLWPGMVKSWAMPGLDGETEWLYLVPLILGIMLVWRLAPKGAWISRWPLAFIIGTTAGMRMVGFIHADFLSQIKNSVKPIYFPVDSTSNAIYNKAGEIIAMPDSYLTIWSSLGNIIIIVGVLASLVYFFFSIEHKGIVGKTAKLGIWFLMVTFGAAFGYTVMGRIALLAIRVEFLVDDWLWLIDPLHRHAIGGG
ncbi:MAG: hypothetical protein KAS72_00125 [Phycisphaerales bacterium]|nr:hypothetical protein [Phycisphaerales bacterium]